MAQIHKLIDKRIYLASQSPRRRDLLKQIGVAFEVLPLRAMGGRADVVETPKQGESAVDFVQRMACEKAATGWHAVEFRHLLKFPVLSADTLIDLDGEILGKPTDRHDAAIMLTKLANCCHWVHTAVSIQRDAAIECVLTSSKVEFGPLSTAEIRHYLDSGEFTDKAGAYGIQGRAAAFVKHISGSYTGIMGLPLFETSALLKQFGIITS